MSPEVRNQGDCGSCSAFAVLEIAQFINNRKRKIENKPPKLLSAQDIVDCFPYRYKKTQYNNRCERSHHPMDLLWLLLSQKYGGGGYSISTEENYKYTANGYGKCKKDINRIYIDFDDVGCVKRSDEIGMLIALMRYGPLAATIKYPKGYKFDHYSGGIFSAKLVDNTNYAVHAVTIVGWGYDEELGLYYWIVKNSFGPHWGENGYVKIIRNNTNYYNQNIDNEVYFVKLNDHLVH